MIAFLFPGQGSQTTGMGQDLYEGSALARSVLDSCNEALDFDLTAMMFTGSQEDLTQTETAQPALLAHSAAAAAVLAASGVQPTLVAGHSLGEYSALTAAGCLEAPVAARLVRARGRLMAEAGRETTGTMAALIGIGGAAAQDVVEQAKEVGVVAVANYNSQAQVVISGEPDAVSRASELAVEAGARRAILLKVSGAFHSPLMEPVSRRFSELVSGVAIVDAKIPVICNVDAQPHSEANQIRECLVRQLTASVRWQESIERMVEMGVDTFVEVGTGNVLTNMLRRENSEVACFTTGTFAELAQTVEALGGTLSS